MACNNRVLYLIWIVSLATMSIPAFAQKTHRLEDVASCRQIAEDFYRWYVPLYEKPHSYRTADIAIQRKATVFAPALLRALKVDFAAQRRSNEIIGIDFDPFVGSDGGENYEVRKVSLKRDRCFAEVWQCPSNDNSWKPSKPDVVAELSKQTGHWQFRNFAYLPPAGSDDLSSALAWWRRARAKQKYLSETGHVTPYLKPAAQQIGSYCAFGA